MIPPRFPQADGSLVFSLALLAAGLGLALWLTTQRSPGHSLDLAPATLPADEEGDLLYDFAGRRWAGGVPWRLEGKVREARLLPDGLLVLSSSTADPPRIVLEPLLEARSIDSLELELEVNKGRHGRVWLSRYHGEKPGAGRSLDFPLAQRVGRHTYLVRLADLPEWRGPLHALSVQLADGPVRAVVRSLRLVRSAAWRSQAVLQAGRPCAVAIGETALEARAAPAAGSWEEVYQVPGGSPRLRFALGFHPLQRAVARADTEFTILVREEGGARGEQVLFQRVLAPGRPVERRWRFLDADLLPWAGRRVRLEFQVRSQRGKEQGQALAPGRPPWALPLWGPVTIAGRLPGSGPAPVGLILVVLDRVGREDLGAYGGRSRGLPLVDRLSAQGGLVAEEAYAAGDDPRRSLLALLGSGEPPAAGGASPLSRAGEAVRDLRRTGLRTAAFYTGEGAPELLGDAQLLAGFEFAGRGDSELGLGPREVAQDPAFPAGAQPPPAAKAGLPGAPGVVADRDAPAAPRGSSPTLPATGGFVLAQETAEPGPLTWLGWTAGEPFFLLLHLDAGPPAAAGRQERLAAIDRALQRLIGRLRELGLAEGTSLCLTSLRGPQGELRSDPGCGLYEETVHVPAVFVLAGALSARGPAGGEAESRGAAAAGTAEPGAGSPAAVLAAEDLLPAWLALAGLGEEPGRPGRGFAKEAAAGEAAGAGGAFFLSAESPGRRYFGLRQGRYKLIWRTLPRSRLECYDLEVDPLELENLWPSGAAERPLGEQEAVSLLRRLEGHFGGRIRPSKPIKSRQATTDK